MMNMRAMVSPTSALLNILSHSGVAPKKIRKYKTPMAVRVLRRCHQLFQRISLAYGLVASMRSFSVRTVVKHLRAVDVSSGGGSKAKVLESS